MIDFSNQVVLITGSSRGIGRETAVLFAQQKAHVAIHYNRNQQAAQQTKEMLAGDNHLIVQANISQPDDVKQMIEQVVAHYGRLDVLVNNAAIYEEHPIDEVSYDEWQASWQRVIQTNLIGSANAMYCAAQQMIKQGGGRIVNVSSRGAFRGEPTGPAYGASKGGLNSLSQSMAKQLAKHNIFVNAIAPGFVETEMVTEHLGGPAGADIRNQSPLGRVAMPQEVAYTILFLASEQAKFTTGAILDINGASYFR